MNIRKFKKRYWLTLLCFILLYYVFIHGPLFAWSPIKPGYEEFTAQTYSVHYVQGTELPEVYKSLDQYISETGTQFALPVTRKIIVIRADKSNFQKYIPWMKTDGLGGVALQTGDVLYINHQQIAKKGLNEGEYLKHELVHLMLHQNANIVNSLNAAEVTYLSEGVPFYAGGPRFYTREELLEKLKKVKLQETTEGHMIYTEETFSQLDEETAERYKVSHTLYGEFVGYLIDIYGQDKFNAFNHDYLKTPSIHRQLFEEYFGRKTEVVLQEFEEQLYL